MTGKFSKGRKTNACDMEHIKMDAVRIERMCGNETTDIQMDRQEQRAPLRASFDGLVCLY